MIKLSRLETILMSHGKTIELSDLGFDFCFLDKFFHEYGKIIKHVKEVCDYRVYLTIAISYNAHGEVIISKKYKLRIFKGEIHKGNKSIFSCRIRNSSGDYSLKNCMNLLKKKDIDLYKILNKN